VALESIGCSYATGRSKLTMDRPLGLVRLIRPSPYSLLVMRIRLIAMPALLVAILLATAGTTDAAQNVPPGVSGANQYTETLPGPGGNSAAGGGGSSAGGGAGAPKSSAQTLGATNARKLEALGPEGKAAAELATQSSPASSNSKRAGDKDAKPSGPGSSEKAESSISTRSSDAPGSSGVQQVLGQITGTGGSDSGGMNWLLPLLIGASVVVAATYLFTRHRPARPQD
jgi:hypothetical protein